MSLLSLLRKRRSVRRYLKKPVSPRVQARLKEACLRAPSSRDLQPWTFHFVEKPELLAKLSKLKPHHAAFIKQAPLAVVIGARDKDCDTWIEDCSIAAILLQLAGTDAGLGSCWVQVHKRHTESGDSSEQYVRDCLNLPIEERVLCIIAMGYPAAVPKPIATDKLHWEAIWRMH